MICELLPSWRCHTGLRRQPFTEVKLDEDRMNQVLDRAAAAEEARSGAASDSVKKKEQLGQSEPDGEQREGQSDDGASGVADTTGQQQDGARPGNDAGSGEKRVLPDTPYQTKRLESDRDRMMRRAAGKRTRTRTNRTSGRYIGSRRANPVTDLALDATLREAAPFQRERREANGDQARPQKMLAAPG